MRKPFTLKQNYCSFVVVKKYEKQPNAIHSSQKTLFFSLPKRSVCSEYTIQKF